MRIAHRVLRGVCRLLACAFSLLLTPTLSAGDFEDAQRAGAKLIDVGCMQINHHFHARHFASLEDMLDPAQNVAYAARFLSELKKREGSWTMAIARYHAGPDNVKAQRGYVCRVIGNMVEAGFGEWTDAANAYCRR